MTAKLDIILITTGSRPELLRQSLDSIYANATDHDRLSLTLVCDGYNGANEIGTIPSSFYGVQLANLRLNAKCIVNLDRQGASASRNIGASSIPKYRRGDYVCFFDDDVYCAPRWDEKLIELARFCDLSIISGHSHPFNHCDPMCWTFQDRTNFDVETKSWHSPGCKYAMSGFRTTSEPCVIGCGAASNGPYVNHGRPLVISTVNMLMPWAIWDDVGYFQEPGGAGGSEDYDYCMRAKAKGYGFAVTEPQCVIHTGLTSTTGKQIVGYEQMVKQNEELIQLHRLEGVMWK